MAFPLQTSSQKCPVISQLVTLHLGVCTRRRDGDTLRAVDGTGTAELGSCEEMSILKNRHVFIFRTGSEGIVVRCDKRTWRAGMSWDLTKEMGDHALQTIRDRELCVHAT
jgi:hypothetical protein